MAKQTVYAVVGLGAFGLRVCEVLSEKGVKIIAIDNHPDAIDKIKQTVSQAILLDATDEISLNKVPFDDVDVAIVGIGDDMESSIVVTAHLRAIGVPRIVARAVRPIHRKVLLQVGADEVINIEEDAGQRLATRLTAPEVLDKIPLSETLSIAELFVPEEFVGSSLQELDFRKRLGLIVVALRRTLVDVEESGEAVPEDHVIFPEPTEVLKQNDILVVAGKDTDIEELRRIH